MVDDVHVRTATGDWPVGSALLLTRASPHADIAADFDAWQYATHLPDLMAAPASQSVFYGRADRDHLADEGVSEHAGRVAIYAAADLDGLMTFVGSPEVDRAIADGSRWFGRFDSLDGEPYTGNVYRVQAAWGSASTGTWLEDIPTLVVARLEVPPEALEEFDSSIHRDIAPGIARAPSAPHVRACTAHREGVPVPYYSSRGNRAVLVSATSPLPTLTIDDLIRSLRRVLDTWSATSNYATLEVFTRDVVLRGN